MGTKESIDLSKISNKPIDPLIEKATENKFEFTTSTTNDKLTFKLLTHGDETKIQQELGGLRKINKDSSAELSTRLKYMLTGINDLEDTKSVREFVDNRFLARDSREFRKFVTKIQPDVDLKFYPDGAEEGVDIPIGITFLWPDINI